MNRRRWALVVWVLLVTSYTFASGFAIPPHEGTADPDGDGADSGAQLERLLTASADGSDRFSLTPSTSVHGPTELTVMVAPERHPYPTEGRALEDFMEDGGTLVLFAANTAWNDFLADHRIQLDGAALLPTANPSASNLLRLDLPAELGSGQLLMPNATAVTTSEAATDVTTYQPEGETVLDENGNGTIEVPPDQAGRFPVAAQTPVGDGQLVVVASSEAVLGPGLERNLDAVGGLLETLADGDPAAFDAGTHPRGWKDAARAPAGATLSVAQASLPAVAVIVLVGVGLVALLPKDPHREEETGSLDEYTDATREVMLDRAD